MNHSVKTPFGFITPSVPTAGNKGVYFRVSSVEVEVTPGKLSKGDEVSSVCCAVCGVRCGVVGVRCAVCGVRCAVCGVRCAVCGAWCVVLCAWCIVANVVSASDSDSPSARAQP